MSLLSELFNKKERKEESFVPLEATVETPKSISIQQMTPKARNEATDIADAFEAGFVISLDLSEMEQSDALRLIDFLAGVVYAKKGAIKRYNGKNVILAPYGVDLTELDQML